MREARALVCCGVLLALSGTPAWATAIDRCVPFGCVKGEITVRGNVTRWDFRVADVRADGFCAYAKVEIDVSRGPDPVFCSENACPRGHTAPLYGSDAYADTRGARVSLCRNDGRCNLIRYERRA